MIVSYLIERNSELSQLQSCLESAQSGRGQIALISGEPGIGKTSLLRSFKNIANQKDTKTRWYSGGCEALFTPRTLGPFFDMAGDMGEKFEQAILSEDSQTRIYSALLRVLNQDEPCVIICEDLHWADHATIDLIKFLGRRIVTLPLLLILTFRDDDISIGHPLTQLLGDLPGDVTTRLPLSPLSEQAVSRLAGENGGDGKWLHEITNGNPFFVTELLASRPEPGYLPASVKDAVALRLAQLQSDERELLERICVLAKAPTYEFLEKLLGSDAMDVLARFVSRGFLAEVGTRIYFRHELARLATYDRITPARRRRYHADCLRIMLERSENAPLDQIVHHASNAHENRTVQEYAPKAAHLAARAGAHIEAAAHYGLALKFVEYAEPEQAATLYENWAYEASLADHMDDNVLEARRHAITLWRALGRQDKLAENLRHLSRLHWYRGEVIEAGRIADQAIGVLEALPASSERAMAYSMRSQFHMLNDQMDDAVRWGKMALEFEAENPNPEIRMHALNNIGTALAFRNHREGVNYLRESLALALTHDHHENAARAYNNLGEFALEFRDFAMAEQIINAGLAYDSEHDLDAWTHYLSGRLAQLRLDQGRIDDAITIVRGIIDTDKLSLISKLPAQLVMSHALMRRGDAEAESLLQETLLNALATDELQHIVPARMNIVEWAWLTDKPKRVGDHMQHLLTLSSNDRHPWNIGLRAAWADRLGLADESVRTVELPEPYRLELAGDYSGAAKLWDKLGLPYDAALLRIREASQASLTQAYQALKSMKAHLAAEKVMRIAEREKLSISKPRASRGPYKAARNHPLGLTSKEQSILKLLQEGLSNREIATELSRSQRTIEHHVSSVLAKLNAPNRMAAILRVQREPWLTSEADTQAE